MPHRALTGTTAQERGERLRAFLVSSAIASGSACVVLLSLALSGAPVVWALFAGTLFSLIAYLSALYLVRRGQVVLAAIGPIIGSWLPAIYTTAIMPQVVAVNVAAVLLPVILFFEYFPRRFLRLLLVLTVLAVASLTAAFEARRQYAYSFDNLLISIPALCAYAAAMSWGITSGIAGLHARLTAQQEAVRASRARIAGAADEARRAIERDLHDGAQQRLVSLQVRLTVVERRMATDPTQALNDLKSAKGEVAHAMEELRDLARGVYPPLLSDSGLPAALPEVFRRLITPCTYTLIEVGRYSTAVESAVYFTCLEALQNVDKHALAESVRVTLDGTDGLLLVVADDGQGFDTEQYLRSGGLTGMADRIDGVDGTLKITSAPGKGATVRAHIPTAPAESRPRLSARSG